MGVHLERSLPLPVSFEIDIYGPTFGFGHITVCPRFNRSKAIVVLDSTAVKRPFN